VAASRAATPGAGGETPPDQPAGRQRSDSMRRLYVAVLLTLAFEILLFTLLTRSFH
jgi:hypothetical protein